MKLLKLAQADSITLLYKKYINKNDYLPIVEIGERKIILISENVDKLNELSVDYYIKNKNKYNVYEDIKELNKVVNKYIEANG